MKSTSLLSAPKTLKAFVYQFKHRKQILVIEEEHIDKERDKLNTEFSSCLNSFMVDVLLFVTALITIIVMMVVIYMVCGHSKLKTLVTNMALQQMKGIVTADPRLQDIHCTCKTQWYMTALLLLVLLGIVFIITNKIRKSNLLQGHLFSNVTKVMLFISDSQSYVLISLRKVAQSIHLFRIGGRLTSECINFKRNCIWDVLKIDWKEVRVTLNENDSNLLIRNYGN